MPFLDSLDIANRALQHCGAPQIVDENEDSKSNQEVSFAYDKVRRAELQRNTWRFAIRKVCLRAVDASTLLLNAPAYDAAKIYMPGAIVQDANGQHWISLKPENMANPPGGNNEFWDAYFGPLSVPLWSSGTTYSTGELVYMAGTNPGSYQVYMSLTGANADTPNVATAWNSATTYYADQVVSYGGSQWRSLLPFNIGTTPADGALGYDAATTYTIGQTVTGSDNFIYSSVGNGNIGNDPTTDGGVHWTNTNVANAWSRTPALTVSAMSWLPIGSLALRPLTLLYPVGSGPINDTSTRNVYRLPAGYLREAPQDPKAGSVSYLGAPSGLPYNDWLFENDFIVTSEGRPILFRFVADVSIVRKMDDMFCEGLACRLAEAVCEPITQSTSKIQTIASEYKLFMGEARTRNAIEIGSEEPPLDDYIACRA